MRKTAMFLLAAFMWSCQDQGSFPLSPPEPDQVLMAKPDKPPGNLHKGKPPKDEPAAEMATFEVEFTGEVIGTHPGWTQKLSSGAKTIGTPYNQGITLTFNLTTQENGCTIAGTYGGGKDGYLQIGEAKGNKNDPGPYKAWFWFETDGITYLLKMFGTRTAGNWPLAPPADGQMDTATLTLTGWVMTKEGKGGKNSSACLGSGVFSTATEILVERTK